MPVTPKKERPPVKPRAVGPDDGALLLNVSRAHFYRTYLDTGKIRSFKSGRRRLIPMTEIDAILAGAK